MPNNCFPGVSCQVIRGVDVCGACPLGYEGNGQICTDIDGCASDPCNNSACSDVLAPGTGHTCGPCLPGTSGPNCTVADCAGPRYCAGPVAGTPATQGETTVITGTGHNIWLSNGWDTPSGPAVGYHAVPCCVAPPNVSSVGVLRNEPAAFAEVFSAAGSNFLDQPSLVFQLGNLHLINNLDGYATARMVTPSTLALGNLRPSSFTGALGQVPAVVPTPTGLIALYVDSTGLKLRDLAANFTPVSTHDLDTATSAIALTSTCDGNALGTWGGGDAQVFNANAQLLQPRTPFAAAPPSSARTHANFDGRRVVQVAAGEVLEFDASGALATRTPAPDAMAAVGTDAGLLVLYDRDPGAGTGSPVRLIERATGTMLREVTRLPTQVYASDASLVIHRASGGNSVYFYVTDFASRNRIAWTKIDCQ